MSSAIKVFLVILALVLAPGCISINSKSQAKMNTSQIQHGIVCFTFDDGRYEQWLPLLPMFEKYNAHMTFFFSGPITPEVISAMRELQNHGHSIGLHTLNHADAVPAFEQSGGQAYVDAEITPQLKVCNEAGIKIRNFAYPNNRRNSETDEFLMKTCGFQRFRAGIGKKLPTGYNIAEQDCVFYDLDNVSATHTLGGPGIGEYYASTQENLDSALERAARENRLIVFFSHGISMNPGRVDVSTTMMEQTLKTAASLQMAIVGFDEL